MGASRNMRTRNRYRTAIVLALGLIPAAFAYAGTIDRAAIGQGITANAGLILAANKSAAFFVAPVIGTSGAIIPLKIRLPGGMGDGASTGTYTFMMFKGFPEDFRLTAGFKTKNAWMVAIKDLDGLKIDVPAGYTGEIIVDAYLYRGENAAPEQEMFSVSISAFPRNVAATSALSAQPSAAPEKPQAAPLPKRDPSLTKEEEDAMLGQAETQIQSGNIVFARLLFEQLASRGSARGTFQLARTYDPAELSKLKAVGMQGDVEKAKSLYKKAADLGSAQAAESLTALKK